jgi:hypothetical protein
MYDPLLPMIGKSCADLPTHSIPTDYETLIFLVRPVPRTPCPKSNSENGSQPNKKSDGAQKQFVR